MAGAFEQGTAPFLTCKAVGRGQLMVLNVRTFSEQDFHDAGEWLLAPRTLGLPKIPQPLADLVRKSLLVPLGVDFRAPSGVALILLRREACVYSFRDEPVRIAFGSATLDLPAHGLAWVK